MATRNLKEEGILMGQSIKVTTNLRRATSTRKEASLMEIRRSTIGEFNRKPLVETLSLYVKIAGRTILANVIEVR